MDILPAIHELQAALGIEINDRDKENNQEVTAKDGHSYHWHHPHIWMSNPVHAHALKSLLDPISSELMNKPMIGWPGRVPGDPEYPPGQIALMWTLGEENEEKHIVETIKDITRLVRNHPALKEQYKTAFDMSHQQLNWIDIGRNYATDKQMLAAYPKLEADQHPPRFVLAMEHVPKVLAETLARDIGLGFFSRRRLPDSIITVNIGGGLGEGWQKTGGKNIDIPMDHPNLALVQRHISEYLEATKPPRNAAPERGLG